MTSAAATIRVDPPRDRYGRYLLPVPQPDGTVKERVAHSRATTIAGTIADRYNIEKWAKRMVAHGIGLRRDLYSLAASIPLDDKNALNDLAEQAMSAASASKGANTGTALHAFTQRADMGEDVTPPLAEDAADLAAYRKAMAAAGIRIEPWWVERVVYSPELGIAGTLDRLLWLPGAELPVVGDLKTGGFLAFDEIAVQLAIYANARCWYDPATDTWGYMPPVDRERALVVHLPAGTARCELVEVDIAAGADGLALALGVRAYRKRKDIARPYLPGGAR